MVVVAAACAIALVVVGGLLWYRAEQDRAASKSLHEVQVVLDASGFDTSTGSKLPVRVKGSNDAGPVDEVQFVDDSGSGVELARGSYELTFPASPITQDGGLYRLPDTTIRLSIGADAAAGQKVTANGGQAVKLVPVTDPLQVTDEQLDAAKDYAGRDGACAAGVSAEGLASAATAKRDEAAQAKKAAEDQAAADKAAAEKAAAERQQEQQAESAYHVETDSYAFDAPSYWRGRVTMRLDGDTLHVYSKKYPSREICRVVVGLNAMNTKPFGGTSVQVPLSDGAKTASVYYTDYGLMIAYYASINTDDPAAQYTRSEADELVDLQTGGALTYGEYLKLGSDAFEGPLVMGNSGSPTSDKMNALLAGCLKAK